MYKRQHKPLNIGKGSTQDIQKEEKEQNISHLSLIHIYNAECFKRQMSKFIDFSDGKALMVRNGDWLMNMKYIDMPRDVGIHFSVNQMLTAECFKTCLLYTSRCV